MNRIEVSGKVQGRIKAMASKSYAHRALIVASGAQSPSRIFLEELSEDMLRTRDCLQALGARIDQKEDGFEVAPIEKVAHKPLLELGESGSTFRFLLPFATSLYPELDFQGQGRLPERPIKDLREALEARGLSFSQEKLPFTSQGIFSGGVLPMAGDVSSQYISGLLMAGPLTQLGVEVQLTTALESKPYVDMTLEVLEDFGIQLSQGPKTYQVPAQTYEGRDYQVEGDWSNASFFLVAGALGEGIEVDNLRLDSRQGDRRILEVLEASGAQVKRSGQTVQVRPGQARPFQVDLRQMPDALPVLAVLAAASPGTSRFTNARRLRYKESDRLTAVAQMIKSLGGKVEEKEEELLVHGQGSLLGGQVDSFQDHRLVMAAAVASLISQEPVRILHPQAVDKSYPHFFEDWQKLGGKIHAK